MSANRDCHAAVNFSQAVLSGAYYLLEFNVNVGDCNYSTGTFSYSFSYNDDSGTLVQLGPKNMNWGNSQGQNNFTVTDNGGTQIPGNATNLTAVVDQTTIVCTCLG